MIYANSFVVQADVKQIAGEIAQWASRRHGIPIDSEKLLSGINKFTGRSGSEVRSFSTFGKGDSEQYPDYMNFQLSHPQSDLPSRRWITEIGVRKSPSHDDVFISFLLKTEDASLLNADKISASTPNIVKSIARKYKCNLPPFTSRINSIDDLQDLNGFSMHVDYKDRKNPIVLFNSDTLSNIYGQLAKLHEDLLGLAQFFKINSSIGFLDLKNYLHPRYIPNENIIKVIYPLRSQEEHHRCYVENIYIDSDDIKNNLFTRITHYSNVYHKRRHVTEQIVNDLLLKIKLKNFIKSQTLSQNQEDLFNELYDILDNQEKEINLLRNNVEEMEYKNLELDERLKHTEDQKRDLEINIQTIAQQSNYDRVDAIRTSLENEDANPIILLKIMRGQQSLEDCLYAARYTWPDRVVILPSAVESSKESDRAGFKDVTGAWKLIKELCDMYWQELVNGKGDTEARRIFGNSKFAAKESESLGARGKKLRTFTHGDNEYFMEKHLKLGTKDSKAETLRIHFAWDPETKKIIIGHCGKHLDFN